MRRVLRQSLLHVLFCSLILCLGCSQEDRWKSGRPQTVPVSGTIIHNDAPLTDATVTFFPVSGQHTAFARTDGNGKFQLTTFDDQDGAVPGEYRIAVKKSIIEYIPAIQDPERSPPVYHAEHSQIPDRYSDPKTSELTASIPANGFAEIALQLTGQAGPTLVRQGEKLPNIILIIADDLGYGDLGCFGQKLIQTPNIDRMASEGMRFTQAYAGATVCAPSRCNLMSGLHSGHAPIRGNFEIQPEGQMPLPEDTYTLAHMMKDAGYATGLIGKWGLGGPDSESTPADMGFDEFFGYLCQRKAHEYYPEAMWRNDEPVILNGEKYSHDLLAEEALEFIRNHKDDPFFLDLSFTIPHLKVQVPDFGPYADKDWDEKLKGIAAMITRLDSDVGRIMELLKELQIDENTLVFFTSDNGAVHRDELFNHSGPLRGYKRDMYEGGIRSPSIARWPGKIPAGVDSKQIWAFWDLYPTFAELTGQKSPEGLDGISIVPALLDGEIIERPPLYFEFHERGFSQAVRDGDWKGVRNAPNAPLEVYNLSEDPAEANDLASARPDIVEKLNAILEQERTADEKWPIRERQQRRRREQPRPSSDAP